MFDKLFVASAGRGIGFASKNHEERTSVVMQCKEWTEWTCLQVRNMQSLPGYTKSTTR